MSKAELDILRKLREMECLSQIDMALFFGLSKNARIRMGKWEKGDEIPAQKHRIKFAEYLLGALNLIHNQEIFNNIFQILQNEWNWLPISESEKQDILQRLNTQRISEKKTIISTKDQDFSISNSVLTSAHYLLARGGIMNKFDVDGLGVPIKGDLNYYISTLIRNAANKIYILESDEDIDSRFPSVANFVQENEWMKNRVFIADEDRYYLNQIRLIFAPVIESFKYAELTIQKENNININGFKRDEFVKKCRSSINIAFDLLYRMLLGIIYEAEVDISVRPFIAKNDPNIMSTITNTNTLQCLSNLVENPKTLFALDQIMGLISLYKQESNIPSINVKRSLKNEQILELFYDLFSLSSITDLSRIRRLISLRSVSEKNVKEFVNWFNINIKDKINHEYISFDDQRISIAILPNYTEDMPFLNLIGNRAREYFPSLIDLSDMRIQAEQRSAYQKYEPRLTKISPSRFKPNWSD